MIMRKMSRNEQHVIELQAQSHGIKLRISQVVVYPDPFLDFDPFLD